MGRMELEVADVFRRHGATYREKGVIQNPSFLGYTRRAETIGL